MSAQQQRCAFESELVFLHCFSSEVASSHRQQFDRYWRGHGRRRSRVIKWKVWAYVQTDRSKLLDSLACIKLGYGINYLVILFTRSFWVCTGSVCTGVFISDWRAYEHCNDTTEMCTWRTFCLGFSEDISKCRDVWQHFRVSIMKWGISDSTSEHFESYGCVSALRTEHFEMRDVCYYLGVNFFF